MPRQIRPCFTALKVYEKNDVAHTIKNFATNYKVYSKNVLVRIQRKTLIVFVKQVFT